MVTYDDLNSQNDKITELSDVLNKLLSDRGLCDSRVTCDLFFQYVETVQDHLKLEDRHIYRQMLTHRDQGVRNTATKFMSGQVEIKRVFASYLRKWCKKRGHELIINDMCSLPGRRMRCLNWYWIASRMNQKICSHCCARSRARIACWLPDKIVCSRKKDIVCSRQSSVCSKRKKYTICFHIYY